MHPEMSDIHHIENQNITVDLDCEQECAFVVQMEFLNMVIELTILEPPTDLIFPQLWSFDQEHSSLVEIKFPPGNLSVFSREFLWGAPAGSFGYNRFDLITKADSFSWTHVFIVQL